MEKYKNRIWFLSALLSFFVTTIFIYSCEKEHIEPVRITEKSSSPYIEQNKDGLYANVCGVMEESKVLLDDITAAGNTLVYNDDQFLFIEMEAFEEFYFSDAYCHLAYDFQDIPLDGEGDPDYVNFTYQIIDNPISKFRTFKIPLSALEQNNVMLTVGVKVLPDPNKPNMFKLAWVSGIKYGNSWKGRVFKYQKKACSVDDHLTNIN